MARTCPPSLHSKLKGVIVISRASPSSVPHSRLSELHMSLYCHRVSYRGGAWDLPPSKSSQDFYDVIIALKQAVGRCTQWTLTIYYHAVVLNTSDGNLGAVQKPTRFDLKAFWGSCPQTPLEGCDLHTTCGNSKKSPPAKKKLYETLHTMQYVCALAQN